MRTQIINGTIVLKNALLKKAAILIDCSKISRIGKNTGSGGRYLIIDARNCFVSPGFIDTHIHGDAEKIFGNETKFGTTSVVIAESCGKFNKIYEKIDSIRAFIENSPFGPNILGVRFEGPYINKKKRGAQNGRYIRKPDRKELSRILSRTAGLLKIMTIAPELNGADALVRLLNKSRVVASIGHSDATYEEALLGIKAGITHATHIYNAMSGLDRREPGAVGAVLFDKKVAAEIILDLVHVHEMLFRLLLKSKPKEKIILVTDSVRAEYSSYPQSRGRLNIPYYRLKDGTIAGSALTMIDAVKNAVQRAGLSLVDAVKMATLNPARLLGLEKRKGSIDVGKDADIVIFDRDFDAKMTIVNGEIAYRKKGF